MIEFAIAALSIVLFGIAAWTGALVGETLAADRVPFDDGPTPYVVRAEPFAVAGGIVGLMLAMRGIPPMHVPLLAVAVLALAGCAACDWRCGMLPDLLTLGPVALLVAFGLAFHNWLPLVGAAFAFVPFAATALFSHGRGMGWGDVKLAALGGALLGARDVTVAVTLAALAVWIVARRYGRVRKPVAFGPYLAASIVGTFALLGRL